MNEILTKLSKIHDDVIILKVGQDVTNKHLDRLNGSIAEHQEQLDDLEKTDAVVKTDLRWLKRFFWIGISSSMTITTSIFLYILLN